MRRVLFGIFVISGLLAFQSLRAQCPADDGNGPWTSVIDQQWTLPSGCVVDLWYCYRDVWNTGSGDNYERQFYVYRVAIVSGCDGIAWQDIVHQAADQLYQSIGSLPQCGGPINGKLVEITLNSCMEYDPTWQFQNCPTCQMLVACGTGTCSKTCSICFGWDPVTSTYHIFVSNCTLNEQYASNCQDNPPSGPWPAWTCYHIPCNW